jgi:hypothetical protein
MVKALSAIAVAAIVLAVIGRGILLMIVENFQEARRLRAQKSDTWS